LEARRRDGGTNINLRTKEYEKLLNIREHYDDDDDDNPTQSIIQL